MKKRDKSTPEELLNQYDDAVVARRCAVGASKPPFDKPLSPAAMLATSVYRKEVATRKAVLDRMNFEEPTPDYTKPQLSLLAKLGSIAVHAQELTSPTGHGFDKVALEQLLADAEVAAWIKDMGALLPRKR